MVDMVPDAWWIDGGLFPWDLIECVVIVEAKEVDQLAGRKKEPASLFTVKT